MRIHFDFAPQAKPSQSFIYGKISKYGFNNRHAVTVDLFALVAIDSVFHPVRVVGFPILAEDERDLSPIAFAMIGRRRGSHTRRFPVTVLTLTQSALKKSFEVAVVILVGAAKTDTVSGWALADPTNRDQNESHSRG